MASKRQNQTMKTKTEQNMVISNNLPSDTPVFCWQTSRIGFKASVDLKIK